MVPAPDLWSMLHRDGSDSTRHLQAQKLVDVYPKVLAGVQQQQAESWQKQTEDWAAAVKADKDIGGDKLASNLGAAQRAIDTFGTKELKEYLDGTCARSLVNAAP